LTLTRRLALLFVAVLIPALLGSLLVQTLAARDALRAQLRLRNQDAAATLAVALAPVRGEAEAMRALAASAFDAGRYGRLRVAAADGRVLFERREEAPPEQVPRWFASALTLEVEEGRAPVRGDGQTYGAVGVAFDPAGALGALWVAWQRTALLLAAIAALAALLVAWLLRGLRGPLAAAVRQARSIEQARFVTAEEASLPELAEVTRAMNSMVRRLREMFDTQVEQVAQLQLQAQTDLVSGLPVRSQFMGRMGEHLSDPAGPAAALLLVRVPHLERLNERQGREATDRLLQSLADVLLTYVERVAGTCAGRLNGTDFGLLLPVAGIALETAESLRSALEATPAARLAGAEFLIGGCDGLRGIGAGAALAAADAALAGAEQGDGIAVVDLPAAATGGSRAWREQIADALEQGRVQIAAYPVIDPRGALIHLECPLRVQLEPGGEYQVARRWLALAARSRLLPAVDLTALDLALRAIAADGRPRCIHVTPASLASAEFAAAMQARLQARPEAAARLSIEWTEAIHARNPAADHQALRAAAAGWRHLGVTIGVEHAGASPKSLHALKDLGVDYVKVDAQHLRGLAGDEAVRGYAQSLLALIHGLGLNAIAEGIDEPRDLAAVWAIGYDGATGAAVAAVAVPPT